MPGELDGTVALVTGGARGLGRAVAEVFVREGARVVIADLRAEDGVALATALGEAARFVRLDVTSAESWADARDQALAAFGRLDILVNNAGLMGSYPLDQTEPELWDRLLAVMTTGPYFGARAILPHMVERGGGAIVNVASTNAIRGMAGTAAYTAAKHGVLGLTRALALEYAGRGVRVNAVCPGAMRTPMLRDAFGDAAEGFAAHVPLGRLSDPREVAEAISFVASPRASFMVGATVVVDGGQTVD